MIEVKKLTKTYRPKKGETVQALKGIDLKFEDKGLVFILGKSGSGKSTLLNMLGGLDQFDDGEIIIKGKSSKDFVQSDFDSYRNTFIGFIFQEYNILNDFTVGANIALAMELQGKKATNENLNGILKEVDLEGFAGRKPNELSGGQKQRVAIARALIKNPEIIMADEPTGALDSNTGKQVFDTLKRLSKEKLVIVVSHDREFAEQYGDRVIEMKDGKVISDIKKYTAQSTNVSEGIQVINEKIIHIKSGYELTAKDLDMINEYLRQNRENDSFISLDYRTNDKMKQAAQIDENGNQQAFEDTTEENLNIAQYDGSKLRFIKSKLPFGSSLKMAAGSLKKKPFRLIVTILLSTVAFSLFGLVNTMSSYDKINSGTDSIIDSNVDYISFVKEKEVEQGTWSYYVTDKLSEEDIQAIEEKYPDNIFTPVIDVKDSSIDFASNIGDVSKLNPNGNVQYYPSSFPGVAVLSEELIENMGYTLTGSLPARDTEIVITKVAAESFAMGGYLEAGKNTKAVKIASADNLIGKKLNLFLNAQKQYTITGILDTNYDGSRYELFTKEPEPSGSGISEYMLQSEFYQVITNSYHNLLYTNQNVWEQALQNNIGVSAFGPIYDIYVTDGAIGYDISKVAEFSQAKDLLKEHVVLFDSKKTELAKNEIIIPSSFFMQNENLYTVFAEAATEEEQRQAVLEHEDVITKLALQTNVHSLANNWESVSNDVVIAGVYVDTMSSGLIILPDGFLKENQIDSSGKYKTVLANMPEDRKSIEQVVAYSFDNGIDGVKYSLRNSTSNLLENVNSLISDVKNIFLTIGIGFAIFAGVMLMNFITVSISYRKREIGILRAVGARGQDVFRIFFYESTIIALINWVCSIVGTGAAVIFINSIFRDRYNFAVTIFHFGMIQIVLMLGLSLFVAFAASFFPVLHVSKKKPIEVIRKN